MVLGLAHRSLETVVTELLMQWLRSRQPKGAWEKHNEHCNKYLWRYTVWIGMGLAFCYLQFGFTLNTSPKVALNSQNYSIMTTQAEAVAACCYKALQHNIITSLLSIFTLHNCGMSGVPVYVLWCPPLLFRPLDTSSTATSHSPMHTSASAMPHSPLHLPGLSVDTSRCFIRHSWPEQ